MVRSNNTIASRLLIVAFLMVSSCAEDEKITKQKVEQVLQIQRVAVVHPAYRSFISEVLITGTARPNREVMLHAMESGYVESVYADIGDEVRKGETIARLENPELHRTRQKLNAELQGKKSAYDRLRSTYEKTPAITPLQILEDAKAEFLSLQAQMASIDDRLHFLEVRAPFSGIVTQRFVDEGALVQNGINNPGAKALFEVQEVSTIRLSIPLPETNAAAVKKGVEAKIIFPELAGESVLAKVSRTANSLDPHSKTMTVEIDIPNDQGKIKPGMYAKALIRINSRDSVLSLPVTAQVMLQNQPFILVVTDTKVEQVLLRKGLSDKNYFEVLNPDITAKAQIIVRGKGLVEVGEIVQPVLTRD